MTNFSCIIGFFALTLMMGCGDSALTGKSKDSIQLQLQIPEGEDPELFWFDVEKKILRISNKEETKEVSWTSGSDIELDLNEGDQLTFAGFGPQELLLVKGAVTVGRSKNLSIPVSKVL